MMLKFSFIAGIVFIVISAIFSGAWVDGQQQRANFYSETKGHRDLRMKIASYSGYIGIVFLIIAACLYFFS
ncbi:MULTISPECIES: DUF5316 domain-containing protein [Bacillaceae]|uniref:DUF5316 domain-containing protein n=1 Tax=Bacillaceae TaxID=186817 RepID=UPI0005A465A1|nr:MULTISPECIES: DUF5316 domain-containing protein [Bacillaceae]MEC5272299.1 DUF5316 domain-containing protein [Caldifermentibacillus hisashii]